MLIFFGFFNSDVGWQRVSDVLWNFIVDFKSTENIFSVDFDQDFQDFRIFHD